MKFAHVIQFGALTAGVNAIILAQQDSPSITESNFHFETAPESVLDKTQVDKEQSEQQIVEEEASIMTDLFGKMRGKNGRHRKQTKMSSSRKRQGKLTDDAGSIDKPCNTSDDRNYVNGKEDPAAGSAASEASSSHE